MFWKTVYNVYGVIRKKIEKLFKNLLTFRMNSVIIVLSIGDNLRTC